MFSSKGSYKRINKIHKRSVRLILNDYELSFNSLLSTLNEKNDLLTLHKRFTNQIIRIFTQPLPRFYNLRSFNVFATDNPRNKYLLKSNV